MKKIPQNGDKEHKHGKTWMMIVTLILILIGSFFGGKSYYSGDRQKQSLQSDIVSGSPFRMKSALIDPSGEAIADGQIDALKRLFVKDNSSTKSIKMMLNTDEKSPKRTFKFKENGKDLWIYPHYKVVIDGKDLLIDTNIDNPIFMIDGRDKASKIVNGKYQISKLTPGIYDLDVTNAKKKSETKQKQIMVDIGDKDIVTEMKVNKPKESSTVDTRAVHKADNRKSELKNNSDYNEYANGALFGDYSGNPDLSLHPDGYYELGDKLGTYAVLQNYRGLIKIRFDQNDGGSIVESFDFAHGELHSDKYNQSWYKK